MQILSNPVKIKESYMHVRNVRAKAFITHQMLGKVIVRTNTKDLYMVDAVRCNRDVYKIFNQVLKWNEVVLFMHGSLLSSVYQKKWM